MSQFTSSFWDYYIGVISVASILACGMLLLAQSKRHVAGGQAETTGHTWDEDLGEYNNPLPRWWMWLFWITIVWGLAYLALYPGLGSYAGYWKWTQVGPGALGAPLERTVIDELARHRVVAVALHLGAERTHHLRVAVVAALADVDVAAGELQRRVGLQARHRLGHRFLEVERHDLHQPAHRHHQDHQDDEQRLVALDHVVREFHGRFL